MVVFVKFLFFILILKSFLCSKEISEEDFINSLTKYTIKETILKEKIEKISALNFSKYQNIYNEKKINILVNLLSNEIENYETANNLCQLIFLEKNLLNEKSLKKNEKNKFYQELENCNIEFNEKKKDFNKIVNILKDVELFIKTNKFEWIVLN